MSTVQATVTLEGGQGEGWDRQPRDRRGRGNARAASAGCLDRARADPCMGSKGVHACVTTFSFFIFI